MNLLRKFSALLTPAERRRALVLLASMFVGMILEMCSIGLVIPALMLFMESDLASKHSQLTPMLDLLGNPTQVELIAGGVLLLLGVYLIKTVFLTFLAWQQAKFAYGTQEKLSQRLYAAYLNQPYTFYLQRNSAQLIHVITKLDQFTFYGVVPGMLLVTEGLVVLGVAILLVAVEPVGAVIVGLVLGGTALGLQRGTRSRLNRWGETRRFHEVLQLQQLQQGLGGIKEVKVLGREADFLAQYGIHSERSARAGQLHMTMQQFPRLWLELLGVVGIAMLVLTMLVQGYALASIVPVLGLFAFASFRLMPSVSRILGAAQTLQFGLPVVDTLCAEFTLLAKEPTQPGASMSTLQSELALSSVNYTYPSAPAAALQNVSIMIRKGDLVGIIGSSGSGKSTLADIILGLLTPDAGEVRVDGHDIQQHMRAWQGQIGYVPQTIYLTDDTLRRNVAFGLPDQQIDEAAVWRAIKSAQLEEFVAGHSDGLEAMVGERGIRLSGGQRQRIGIARALYHDPAVLMLDEATSALDNATEQGVMRAVTALQGTKTIIIIAHRLTTVANCDKLYRLEHGKVIQEGAYNEVVTI